MKLTLFDTEPDNRFQILIYIVILILQRDMEGYVPNKLGSRTVSIALAMTLMIVMTTYTAILTTRNIESTFTLPVSGMKDQKVTHPTPEFKIATYKDSLYSTMFQQSEKSSWRRLGDFMEPYNFGKFAEAYDKFKQGTLSAAIIDEVTLWWGWKDNRHCDIDIAASIQTKEMGFALTKGSAWNAPVSYYIRKYKINGVLENLRGKYIATKCTLKSENKPNQLSLVYLSGAFTMLLLGVFVSGLLLILEQIYVLCNKKREVRRLSTYTLTHDYSG